MSKGLSVAPRFKKRYICLLTKEPCDFAFSDGFCSQPSVAEDLNCEKKEEPETEKVVFI